MKGTILEELKVDVETPIEKIFELPSKQETILHGISHSYKMQNLAEPKMNLAEMFMHLEMDSLFTKIDYAQSEFDRQKILCSESAPLFSKSCAKPQIKVQMFQTHEEVVQTLSSDPSDVSSDASSETIIHKDENVTNK